MTFWIYMLIVDLFIPCVMVGFGRHFYHNPPTDVHAFFAYKTTLTTKNEDTWQYVHHYFGGLWYVCGAVMIPVSVVALLFVLGREGRTILYFGGFVCCVQIIVMAGTFLATQIALWKTFDRDGNRIGGNRR